MMRGLQGILLFISFFICANSFAQNYGIDPNQIDFGKQKQYDIAGIRIEGIKSLDEPSLIARSGLFIGSTINIPGDEISNAIENLWKLRLFSNVQIEVEKFSGNDAFLIIRLDELPRISRYSPGGLTKGEEEDIVEKIDIVRGTPYTEFVKRDIESKVKDYFADKGFLAVTIDIFEKPDTLQKGWVILFLDIDKGPKTKIGNITFYNNTVYSDRQLKGAMKDTKTKTYVDLFYKDPEDSLNAQRSPLGIFYYALTNITINNLRDFAGNRIQFRLFSSSKFKEDDLYKDKNSIIALYNAKGYRDAKILRDSVYYITNSDIRIDIYVEEGTQYYFRNITWRGNAKYNNSRLDSMLGIHKGDIYNQSLLERKLRFDPVSGDITSLYMDDGYLFFQLTPVEVAVIGDSIDLEIRIQEGPQATIDQVTIKGNTKTNEHVIRRELRTLPGQKFSRTNLIRSQSEIARLGYFDPEQIGINPIPDPTTGTVDIEYTVVERPSDQLELSAGYAGGAYGGVVLQAGIVFNNWSLSQMFKKGAWKPVPSGDGQTFSLRINTNGRRYQSYNIAFVEPWFGGKKPNSLSTSFYRSYYADDDDGNFATVEGSFVTTGISLGYGIRLKWPDDYFTLLSTVSYQIYSLDDYEGFIIEDGVSNNISLKETISRNSTDNPQFPRSGSNISFSVQLTPPYSLFNDKDYTDMPNDEKYKWIEYHKWKFNADWFTPTFGKFILRTGIKFGLLGYYNESIGVSPFERFQLGGDGLSNFNFYGTDIIALRGYEVFTITPYTTTPRQEPVFTKYSIEMRYPISLNPSATIYGMAFLEAGNLYPNFASFDPFNVKRAAGIGMRAWLPMFGLLGIDYGVRFDEVWPGELQPASGFFDYIGKNGKFSIILGFEPE
ncbi:MAG: BamA/TamA family outer membrane protein [Bacteroidetes bacterium]|nr:BamA/TamA family outer membrane protein [Bacteroidota bacterium]MBP7398480.1 BamA/TamA family outer membrane protein [Chitinophagales bacterium]MBK7107959.1 BamA/TamA family outer membrane protein [Bacteroidota bacterium]MBK8486609.1 BamA/TamA family outer membrane protein [Bacteroidota bacterium]MBK8683390.1 BamA/TamA family outer membrane protein [Bacteroidota bacterium]